ncbi:unnamed protein product [Caenorhabditis auriculariae]|uniref:Uncharacterized protein n=1 Tax=Caenorhabditis auriculariae TaxID=2777116 RepID=A0A8S1HC25_9PELO|nr:unnamed protein product [Caenorhabditis auriculariae]
MTTRKGGPAQLPSERVCLYGGRAGIHLCPLRFDRHASRVGADLRQELHLAATLRALFITAIRSCFCRHASGTCLVAGGWESAYVTVNDGGLYESEGNDLSF